MNVRPLFLDSCRQERQLVDSARELSAANRDEPGAPLVQSHQARGGLCCGQSGARISALAITGIVGLLSSAAWLVLRRKSEPSNFPHVKAFRGKSDALEMGCVVEDGVNYIGKHIRSLQHVLSAEDCRWRCQSDARCNGW